MTAVALLMGVAAGLVGGTPARPDYAIIVLGAGPGEAWRKTQTAVEKRLSAKFPLAFAEGASDPRALADAVARLEGRRPKLLVAVPLALSSVDQAVDDDRLALGLSAKRDPELGVSARPPARIVFKTPAAMAPALDESPALVDILADRARSASKNHSREALLLVGEAPEAPKARKRWLERAQALAEGVARKANFAAAQAAALPRKASREADEAALRRQLRALKGSGSPILVPLALTDADARPIERLAQDLLVPRAPRAVLPDSRVAAWVEEAAAAAARRGPTSAPAESRGLPRPPSIDVKRSLP